MLINEKGQVMKVANSSNQLENRLARVLGITGLASTLIISPEFNIDPINWIKLLVLSTGVGISSVYFFQMKKNHHISRIFIVLSVIVGIQIAFTQAPVQEIIWGVHGRAMGLLTWFCLLLMAWQSSMIKNPLFLETVLIYFRRACLLTFLYMIIQTLKLDPIEWQISEPFAFLGNINYSSALMGVFVAGIFPYFASTQLRTKFSIGFLCLCILGLVFSTNSLQGIFMTTFAAVILLSSRLMKRVKQEIAVLFLVLQTFCMSAFLILISWPTFLGGVFFQETMAFRRDYWTAAINMVKTHPFGVGPDGYGNYYREFRSLEAVLRTESSRVSNSAHSIFLDVMANFGFLIALLFLFFIVYILIIVCKNLVCEKSFNNLSISLMWLAFLPQFIIGIANIGTMVWFAIFSGFVVSTYSTRTFSKSVEIDEKKGSSIMTLIGFRVLQRPIQNTATNFLAVTLLGSVGFIVAAPPMIADHQVLDSEKRGDIQSIHEIVTHSWGTSTYLHERLIQTATIRADGDSALSFAQESARYNERSYYSWKVISELRASTPEQRESARARLNGLDPNNPLDSR